MARPNVNRPEWDADSSEALSSSRRAMRLGPRAGTSELGVTLYEVDPGGAVSPYHAHHANEELVLVLSGHPTLRTPTGIQHLEGGDLVAFPRGPAGAHRIFNPSDEAARVLVFSTLHWPEIAEYPDTGATLAMTGPGEGKAFHPDAEQPRAEGVMRAMDAARQHEAGTQPDPRREPEEPTGGLEPPTP
jgi:uncharacterized cupin superfamily protein